MIRILISFLGMIFTVAVFGLPDPYIIEAKVQQDLENSLSKIITKEQFIVQTSAEIRVETERRLVEGENVANAIPRDPEDVPPPTMPGFVPEPTTPTPQLPQQTREVFKTVETPALKLLRVHTSFDDQLPLATVTRARQLITTYLNTNYAGKASLTFGQMPMLKVDKKRELANEQEDLLKKLTEWDKKREKPEPTIEEQAWKYGRWSALFLLALVAIVQFLKPQLSRLQHIYTGQGREAAPGNSKSSGEGFTTPLNTLASASEVSRRQLLERFLIRSEVFRTYYEHLSEEDQKQLYGAFKGPGYDQLLNGLGFPIPENAYEPSDIDELLTQHSKNFDELVKATDWQDRQFFGFLHQLRNDQVLGLAQHVSPRGLAIMLRFMKPHQSANVLDSLPPVRRLEVLSSMQSVMNAPLSESHKLEKEVREIVHQLPQQNFGTEKENLRFWGNVVSESEHQDELLDAIERTNPEIYGTIKKFRFSLDDIATLSTSAIEDVLNDVDNSELGQALATCSESVVDVILDAVSPKRRQVILSQIASYRRVPKEALTSARANLTKRFREALT